MSIPQGLTEEQFLRLSSRLRERFVYLGDRTVIHGSRAKGTAKPDSDIDIAVRLTQEEFTQELYECFGSPRPGSAKERTMQHAASTGKIQAGEVGLRALRNELEEMLGIAVDISLIRKEGPFDVGPFITLAK